MIKVFKGLIPQMACGQIIKEGLLAKQLWAGIGEDNTMSEGRSTKISFIDNPFTKSYMYELVKTHYENYVIEEAEDLQFATYYEGDFYGLHKDADEKNNRIQTITVQLSKSSDYEGGDLVFDYDRHPLERSQGTIIIFPSNLYHKITPVTEGKRYSLVQWFRGKEK